MYRLGSVRDTMKSKSAIIASARFRSTQEMEPPTTPDARRDAMGPRRLAGKLAVRRLRDRGGERRTRHAHRSRDEGDRRTQATQEGPVGPSATLLWQFRVA